MKKKTELPKTVEEVMAHFGGRLDSYGPAVMKYIRSEVLKQFLYITPGTKKRMAYCTHCGKDLDLAAYWPDEYYHWKNNDQVMCPHCGHVVFVKSRVGAEHQAVYFPWWEKSKLDRNVIVCRGIYVQRSIDRETMRGAGITIQADNAIVFVYGKGAAMVMPKKGITVDSWLYENDPDRAPEYAMADRVHDRCNAYRQRCRIYTGGQSLSNAVKGTPFRWAGIRNFPYDSCDTVKAMTMFSRYRAWEWLSKMGLMPMLRLYTEGKAPQVGKCFNWRGKTVDAIFRGHLTKEDKAVLLAGSVTDADFIADWQKWKSYFPNLTLACMLELGNLFEVGQAYSGRLNELFFEHVDPGKLRRWIERKKHEGTYEFVSLPDYLDYLHQLETLHYDMNVKDNIFPRHFQKTHRHLSEQVDMMHRAENPAENIRWTKRRMILMKKYTYWDEKKISWW